VTISHLGLGSRGSVFANLATPIPLAVVVASVSNWLSLLPIFQSKFLSLDCTLRHELRQGCLHRVRLANGISGACPAWFCID